MSATTTGVTPLSPDGTAAAAAVLADAFFDYPVMRHVIDAGEAYGDHLRTLIEFFVRARVWRDEPVLGIHKGGEPVAVALVTLPGEQRSPTALLEHREAVWSTLGDAARHRYEAFGRGCATVSYPEPNLHLSMIGVRRSHAGRGLGRRLMDAVHELARHHRGARGVSLTTEVEANVAFYRHFGYRVAGRVEIAPQLMSWGFFRENDHGVR